MAFCGDFSLMRFFNTAGSCVAGQHYMIDPLSRLDSPDEEAMIDQRGMPKLELPLSTAMNSARCMPRAIPSIFTLEPWNSTGPPSCWKSSISSS
jgi:hypothetical protein